MRQAGELRSHREPVRTRVSRPVQLELIAMVTRSKTAPSERPEHPLNQAAFVPQSPDPEQG